MRLLVSDGEPWPCARAVGYVASGLVHEMCGISLRYIQKNVLPLSSFVVSV